MHLSAYKSAAVAFADHDDVARPGTTGGGRGSTSRRREEGVASGARKASFPRFPGFGVGPKWSRAPSAGRRSRAPAPIFALQEEAQEKGQGTRASRCRVGHGACRSGCVAALCIVLLKEGRRCDCSGSAVLRSLGRGW